MLVRGDLRGVLRARALSQQMVRNMRQNIEFASLYNALGIPANGTIVVADVSGALDES